MDWAFWNEVSHGENASSRSHPEGQLIHEVVVCRGDDQQHAQDPWQLTAGDPQWDLAEDSEADEELVTALANLPPGAYRVSVVLNQPPEAFHITAETGDDVKIHEFIRDPQARIQLVAVGSDEIIGWRYSFAAHVDQQRQVRIHIRRAADGFVAFKEGAPLGPMGMVIEGLGEPPAGEGDEHDADDPLPLVVVQSDEPPVLQPLSTPFVFTGAQPTRRSLGGSFRTQSLSPLSPTSDPIILGGGGGGGGRRGAANAPITPTVDAALSNPVPEPSRNSTLAGLCVCLWWCRQINSRGRVRR